MSGSPQPCADLRPDPAVYLRNMEWLWRWDGELAARVDAVADAARVPLEPTRSGDWTAALNAPDGTRAYLHSRYDPRTEARRMIQDLDVENGACFIVGGFGLGYHLLALAERAAAGTVLVVSEPNLELLAAALAAVDLTPALEDGHCAVLDSTAKARLHDRLHPHTATIMLGAKFVTHAPSLRVASEFHAQIRAMVTDYVAYSRMTLVTLVGNSQTTCRNIAHNLARYVTTPPIDVLKDRFRGTPAIVVSAGPSLRRNIDGLLQARGRAVLCAVQTALKPLLHRGIRPDFVTSLDFHEISRQYFEGTTGLEDVHLVAEPKATWEVVGRYPGPLSLLDNEFARLVIGEELGARSGLPAGATVAHLAFYLARFMGCDPIILVGQDLAFSGHVFYIPGVEAHRTWGAELNRFVTLETKEWERIVRNREILRKVAGNDGTELYTDELLFTYLEQFEKDIARTAAQVINATEGGARIRGTRVMTLAAALDGFCRQAIPSERLAYRNTVSWHDLRPLPRLRAELQGRLGEIDRVHEVCMRMLDLLARLQELIDDPPRFNRLLVQVDELRAQVNQAGRAYRIINAGTQLAELRRFSADRRLSATSAQGADLARQQLARDSEFVTAMRDGAVKMRGVLEEALVKIDVEEESRLSSGRTDNPGTDRR